MTDTSNFRWRIQCCNVSILSRLPASHNNTGHNQYHARQLRNGNGLVEKYRARREYENKRQTGEGIRVAEFCLSQCEHPRQHAQKRGCETAYHPRVQQHREDVKSSSRPVKGHGPSIRNLPFENHLPVQTEKNCEENEKMGSKNTHLCAWENSA
jgi:hypothetical protein